MSKELTDAIVGMREDEALAMARATLTAASRPPSCSSRPKRR